MMPKLIDDWRKAHHFGSVQVALVGAVGALLGGVGSLLSGIGDIAPWLHVASEWIDTIPRWVVWFGAMAFCCGFIIARIFRKKRYYECDEWHGRKKWH